jgi:hypothetical protein
VNRPLGCQNADALAAVNEWLREYREVYPTSRLPELIIAFKIATTRTRRAAFCRGDELPAGLLLQTSIDGWPRVDRR